MKIFIGADHRGFQLKEELKEILQGQDHEVIDCGNDHYDDIDDYPDFAKKVAEAVSADPHNNRGILICGSGVGMAVAADKFKGIRAATIVFPKQAAMVRNDEDSNVLALSADFITSETAKEIVKTFLETPFSSAERHQRRMGKIES